MNPLDLMIDGTGFAFAMTWEGVFWLAVLAGIVGVARWLWWYLLADIRANEAKAKAYRDG